ncbi:MAG: HEPN domain-containing protein [Candidatus Aminicenantes bacterium]|nr:HEPN domain-containing protein [Candidatus Aminicenantes bacterium]
MDEKQRKRFEFWKNAASEEINAAAVLLKNKKLRQSLFFIHLSLEKILKALFIKEKKEHPPITHNLKYIAEKIPLELPEKYEKFLIEATAFNIEARYPDEDSSPPGFQYVNDKYNEAMEVLKWLQKKSGE